MSDPYTYSTHPTPRVLRLMIALHAYCIVFVAMRVLDQTRAARARSAPPRSSTTDLVLRAVSTKTRAVLTKTRAVLTKTRAMKCTPIGVQICELQDFDDFDENNYATRISTV